MSLFGRKDHSPGVVAEAVKPRAQMIAELAAVRANELSELARLDEEEQVAVPLYEAAKVAFDDAQRRVRMVASDRSSIRGAAARDAGALERALRESASPRLKDAHEAAVQAVRWMHGLRPLGGEFSFEEPETEEGRKLLKEAPAKLEALMLLDLNEDELQRRITAISEGLE